MLEKPIPSDAAALQDKVLEIFSPRLVRWRSKLLSPGWLSRDESLLQLAASLASLIQRARHAATKFGGPAVEFALPKAGLPLANPLVSPWDALSLTPALLRLPYVPASLRII